MLILFGACAAAEDGPPPPPRPVDLFARIAQTRVTVELDAARIDLALDLLALRSRIGIRPTDRLLARSREVAVTLRAKDAPLGRLLDVLAASYGLAWRIERDIVRVDVGPLPPSPKA